MRVLRRFVPDTLFGRLLAILLLAIAVSQSLGALLILRERAAFTNHASVAFWSGSIAEVLGVLERLSGPERDRLLQQWADAQPQSGPDRRVEQPVDRADQRDLEREVAASLGALLGYDPQVRLSPADAARPAIALRNISPGPLRMYPMVDASRRWDIDVQLADHHPIRFRVADVSPPLPIPLRLVVNQVFALLILIAGTYLMARIISQPLSRLAAAAELMGRGEGKLRVAEEGAREMRFAARAFNTMQDRVSRYLDGRTRVLAAMSHDLRTPLTRLRLRVESLDADAVREKMIRDFDEMESMIAGALRLFRGEDSHEQAEEVDLNALLEDIAGHYQEVGANVNFKGRLGRPIQARPRSLKRCLMNLIDNAIRFGERADVSVSDGKYVAIRIADDGPGLAEVDLERVFEPFFRTEESRNRDGGGAGLGLSIARDVAESHGGTLQLENRREGGLVATLTLPRERA